MHEQNPCLLLCAIPPSRCNFLSVGYVVRIARCVLLPVSTFHLSAFFSLSLPLSLSLSLSARPAPSVFVALLFVRVTLLFAPKFFLLVLVAILAQGHFGSRAGCKILCGQLVLAEGALLLCPAAESGPWDRTRPTERWNCTCVFYNFSH